MSTSDDRPRPDGEPTPPAWDAPPQPPAWDAPLQQGTAAQPYGRQQPQYGAPPGWGPPQGYGAPPGYGPPPGYGGAPAGYGGGYGGPGWAGPQQTDTKAIIALVLAIGSFVVLPLIPAIVALVLAGQSRREIDASAGRLTGEGLVTAARVVSWINIGLCVAVVVLFVVLFGVLATTGFSEVTTPAEPLTPS